MRKAIGLILVVVGLLMGTFCIINLCYIPWYAWMEIFRTILIALGIALLVTPKK